MIRLVLALLLTCLATDAMASRRVAVVVGANGAPPGRTTLRYGHVDANAFASVLMEVGRFRADDVVVLHDPSPDEVLRALDGAASVLASEKESLLLFYYSGHADHGALFPGGKTLPLQDLKQRLEAMPGSVRLGILDACRGGSWTGAKGLHPDDPFDVGPPIELGSEGTILVASSSGLEDAHEAEAVGGSFFTHHLIAGLRGAADQSGDGAVTVTEAFDYARRLTVRDSALHARMPQTPSFDLNLRGRRDVVLTRVDEGDSRVALKQAEGPLEVIRLDAGLVVAELPPGRLEMALALPPGGYLVRRRSGGSVFATEIDLAPGAAVVIAEEDLLLVGGTSMLAKGTGPQRAPTSLAPGDWELRFGLGRVYDQTHLLFSDEAPSHGYTGFTMAFGVGLTERLSLSITFPGLGWRLGTPGEHELLLWGGFHGGAFGGGPDGQYGTLLPGLIATSRHYLRPNQSLIFGGSIHSPISWDRDESHVFEAWSPSLQLGYLVTLGDAVTVGVGMNATRHFEYARAIRSLEKGAVLAFGSVLELGVRPVPLVQVHAFDSFSLDGYVEVGWNLSSGELYERYLGGFTWSF